MPIKTVYGFILKCRICNTEIMVSTIREFEEQGTGWRTAYYDLETGHIVGVSEGTGDTFECILCHIVKWGEDKNKLLPH